MLNDMRSILLENIFSYHFEELVSLWCFLCSGLYVFVPFSLIKGRLLCDFFFRFHILDVTLLFTCRSVFILHNSNILGIFQSCFIFKFSSACVCMQNIWLHMTDICEIHFQFKRSKRFHISWAYEQCLMSCSTLPVMETSQQAVRYTGMDWTTVKKQVNHR